MGSPVSPIISNLYMEHIEQKAMENCPPHLKPDVWLRYVDDIFELAPRQHIDELTQYINTVDETGNIKFTVEVEENSKLPVLDVLVTRLPDGSMSTSVYRKKTHTDQYLNFSSHHPLHHKLGVIRSLLDRKDTIVTEDSDKEQEDKHICEALRKNGYPNWSIKLAKQQKVNQKKKKDEKKKSQNTQTKKKTGCHPIHQQNQ